MRLAAQAKIADTASLKDLWAAYRKKEIQMNCNVSGSMPIEVALDELPDSVAKMSVEAEQIGDKVLTFHLPNMLAAAKRPPELRLNNLNWIK